MSEREPRRGRRLSVPALVALLVVGMILPTASLALLGARAYLLVDAVRDRHRPVTSAPTPRPAPESTPAPLRAAERSARGQAVESLLARRSRALLTNDRRGFLADVDRGDPAFLARQGRLFDDLRAVRFNAWSYTVVGEYGRDLSPRYGGPTWVPAVLLRFRVAGFDSGAVAEALAPTFVQRDGRWLLAGEGDLDAELPEGGHAQPWDVGAVAVARGTSSIVIGSAEDAAKLPALAADVDRAVTKVRRLWGRGPGAGWSGRVVVIASRDERVLGTYLRRTPDDPTDAAAIAVPTFDEVFDWLYEARPAAPTGSRVILHPTLLEDIGEEDLRRVLAHEVTHVAMQLRTGPGTPTWLAEGVAAWTEFAPLGVDAEQLTGELSRRVRGDGLRLPPSGTFYAEDAESNYELARQVCAYIVERHGVAGLRRLYDRFARFPTEAAALNGEDAAFRDALGTTPAALLGDLTAALRAQS